MKWIVKLVEWILRETWWRRDFKRIILDEKTTWGGRCLKCDAYKRCSIIRNRNCPCKYNQCLKYK